MTLLDRGRTAVLAGALSLGLMLSGCGGDEPSPLDEAQPDDSSAADARAQDEKDVEELYESYWQIRVDSENSATIDEQTYTGVLAPQVAERQGLRIQRYQDRDLVRVGQPAITEIEVSISGDTAQVLACQDEAEWRAEIDGELIPPPEVKGNVPTGATAERQDAAWIITELTDGDAKECA